MYQRTDSYPLNYSVSPLNNNLNCCSEVNNTYFISVVHKSLVNIVSISNDNLNNREVHCGRMGGLTPSSQPFITQVKWVPYGNTRILVVVSQKGVQIFDASGLIILLWHEFPTEWDDTNEDVYGNGIGAIGDLLCVGLSNGEILSFHLRPENDRINCIIISYCGSVKEHNFVITSMCSSNDVLYSSDEQGYIVIWKHEQNTLVKKNSFSETSYCTSMELLHEFLITAFSNGCLKVFSTEKDSYTLLCAVDAHAKAITAVDIAKECNLILTASEDSYAKVWQLKTNTTPLLSLKYSTSIPDSPLHGAQFIGQSGNKFCVTGYDMTEILVYSM